MTVADSRKAGTESFLKGLERSDRNMEKLAGSLYVAVHPGGLAQAIASTRREIQVAAAYIRNMEEWLAWASAIGRPLSELIDLAPKLAPLGAGARPDPAIDPEADAIRRAIREIADADSGVAERQIPVVGGPHDGQMLEVIHTARIFVTSPDRDHRLRHIHAGYERDDAANVYRFIGYWQHHICGPYTPVESG